MHRYLPFIFLTLIVWLFLCCGCSNTRLHPGLSEAKGLVEDDTDSCLVVLESIDSAELKTPYDKAFYNLMMLRALDKSHLPITHLSAEANDAVEYFDAHGDAYTRMLSHFCRGRLYHNVEDYNHAIIDISEAFDLAEQSADWFWMGMAARSISDIFNATFNSAEELHWSQKALEYFEKSGKTDYRNYAIHDLAMAYIQGGDYDKAITVLTQLSDTALVYEDDFLWLETMKAIGLANLGAGNHSIADSIFTEYCHSPYSTAQDSAYWALSLADNKSYDKLRDVLKELNIDEFIQSLYAKEEYFKHIKSWEEAIATREIIDSIIDATIKTKVNTHVAGAVINSFNDYRKYKRLEMQNAGLRIWVGIVFMLVVIVSLLSYIFVHNRNYKIKMQEKMLLVKDLINTPLITYNTVNDLGIKDSVKFLDLISEKHQLISNLCQTMYDSPSTNASEKRLSAEIDKTIKLFKEDEKMFMNLTLTIDKYCNDLCKNIKKHLPDLSERDYRLVVYSFLGFSNSAIAMLLEFKTPTDVSKRRSRVMEKFDLLPDDILHQIEPRMRRNTRKKIP